MRSSRASLLLGIVASVWSSACSSTVANPDGDGLVACSWPAELAQTDSSSGQCRSAARAVLACTDPTGAGAVCVTSDARCDTSGTSLASPLTCVNKCDPTEFGIVCGTVGPGPAVTPPPNCHSVGATPAGIAFYCCPCGA